MPVDGRHRKALSVRPLELSDPVTQPYGLMARATLGPVQFDPASGVGRLDCTEFDPIVTVHSTAWDNPNASTEAPTTIRFLLPFFHRTSMALAALSMLGPERPGSR